MSAETTRDAAQLHTPVLVDQCMDLLAPALTRPDSLLIDATLGMGGHTHAALTRFPHIRVVGIDRDPQAIALASERLREYGQRFEAVNTTYDQ
ncbi:16S rRNA (cytosine(1402)-N(4))-methyltransferase, partial [Streptococcus anginosus]|nr:16S rRNA (cytosine(1402)-N(4))-methyltransferase [Streptococcus anginosus]